MPGLEATFSRKSLRDILWEEKIGYFCIKERSKKGSNHNHNTILEEMLMISYLFTLKIWI